VRFATTARPGAAARCSRYEPTREAAMARFVKRAPNHNATSRRHLLLHSEPLGFQAGDEVTGVLAVNIQDEARILPSLSPNVLVEPTPGANRKRQEADHAVLAVDSDIGDHGALDVDVTFGVGFSERRPLAALPITLAQPLDAGAGGSQRPV
jgi:hypothetical protein